VSQSATSSRLSLRWLAVLTAGSEVSMQGGWQADGTSAIGLLAAVVLAGVALYYYRHDRARGRVFACLACALGFSYIARSTGKAPLEWLSWAFLALGLGFLVRNRKTRDHARDRDT
jgi:hypothetical protein